MEYFREYFLLLLFLWVLLKRTIEAQIVQKLKNNEARPKCTGSYKKKKSVPYSTVPIVFYLLFNPSPPPPPPSLSPASVSEYIFIFVLYKLKVSSPGRIGIQPRMVHAHNRFLNNRGQLSWLFSSPLIWRINKLYRLWNLFVQTNLSANTNWGVRCRWEYFFCFSCSSTWHPQIVHPSKKTSKVLLEWTCNQDLSMAIEFFKTKHKKKLTSSAVCSKCWLVTYCVGLGREIH